MGDSKGVLVSDECWCRDCGGLSNRNRLGLVGGGSVVGFRRFNSLSGRIGTDELDVRQKINKPCLADIGPSLLATG